LLDANEAMRHDLPKDSMKRSHWLAAGWAVVEAAKTNAEADISAATELLVAAIEREGWMARDQASRVATLLGVVELQLRDCIAASR
jgi:hypothetical protein